MDETFVKPGEVTCNERINALPYRDLLDLGGLGE
jgi:hypothetical protein